MRAMSSRRTFLKLLGIAAGATGIVHYAEPIQQIAQVVPHHDWVEDRGDFYVVRVPDLKMFANEQLKKPTIFILGAGAILKSVAVEGFCNIAAPEGGLVLGCYFDASKVATERPRPALEVKGQRLVINGGIVQGSTTGSSGIHILM